MVMDVRHSRHPNRFQSFGCTFPSCQKNSKHNTLTEYFNFPRISDNSLKLALTLSIMNS
jgi:hypothetical protein